MYKNGGRKHTIAPVRHYCLLFFPTIGYPSIFVFLLWILIFFHLKRQISFRARYLQSFHLINLCFAAVF